MTDPTAQPVLGYLLRVPTTLGSRARDTLLKDILALEAQDHLCLGAEFRSGSLMVELLPYWEQTPGAVQLVIVARTVPIH